MTDDDGCLLTCPRLFRGALGMRKSVVSGSGRRQWFLFGVGDIGMGRKGTTNHGVRVMFHCMSCLRTVQNLCFYVLYHQSMGLHG